MTKSNTSPSGFLLRGAGSGVVGPYCGTPPPNEGRLKPGEGYW
jgi:hypothetical protein